MERQSDAARAQQVPAAAVVGREPPGLELPVEPVHPGGSAG